MKKKILSLMVLAVGMFMLSQPGSATVIIEAFDKAPLPVGWTPFNDNYDFAQSSGTTRLRLSRPVSGGGSNAIYYTGSTGEGVEGLMQDFSLEMTFRFGGGGVASTTVRGVVFRTQDMSLSAPSANDFWGYSLGVIAVGENRGFYLFENPTGITMAGSGTELVSQSFAADLANNYDYTLTLSVSGERIEAALLGENNEVLASLVYEDAVVTAGYFGLRAANANTNINTYYSDLRLEVTTISEASGLGLSAAGALLLFIACRYRGRA